MKGLVWSQFLQLDTLCNLALRGPLLHMKLVWQWDLRMMIFNFHQNQISRNPNITEDNSRPKSSIEAEIVIKI